MLAPVKLGTVVAGTEQHSVERNVARHTPDAPAAVDSAAERTLRVLEAVTAPGGPHRLGEVAAAAVLPKSSAHRVLAHCVERGWVVADGEGRYAVGARLRALAARVTGRGDDAVGDLLAELQAAVGGHAVHVATRDGDRAVYTHKLEGVLPVRLASRIGMSIPLHSTAIGKALLAALPPVEVEAVVGRTGLPRRTPATVSSRRRLQQELARVRTLGYAVDDEENEPNNRCVAVAFTDPAGRVSGAVSVSTVVLSRPGADLAAFVPALRTTADRVAHALD